MSEPTTRIGKRRGTAPDITNGNAITLKDGILKCENVPELRGPLDDPNIDLDNLQRGGRSVSMTYGPIKGLSRGKNGAKEVKIPSITKAKAHLLDLKHKCHEPVVNIMQELSFTFSNLAKNRKRLIVNFDQRSFDVEPVDATFRGMNSEDISFDQTLTKYPNFRQYYESNKKQKECLPLQKTQEPKDESWLNDTDADRACYYPILKPRYERPRRIKVNPVVDQKKSKEKIKINGQDMDLTPTTVSPPRQKRSERYLELPQNVSNRSLRSINANSSDRNLLNSEKSQGEFKTFILTAMGSSQASGVNLKEEEAANKKVEIIKEDKKFEIQPRQALEPLQDQMPQKEPQIKFYDKVRRVQNDIIKKSNFSPNFERPLRAQFDRLLGSLTGKSQLGKRNVSLVTTLRKEVASMPATHKLY